MNHSSVEAIHTVPSRSGDRSKRKSLLPDIVARLKDPSAPIADVVRLIAIEIAHVIEAMSGCEESDTSRSQLKSNMEQVRSLRLLSRNLVESDVHARRDVLNMDGPKLKFVWSQWMEGLKEALEKVTQKPTNDASNQSIIREFRDIMATREQDIRREVAKIDS